MVSYFARQLDEIRASKALLWLGCLLGFCHVALALHWVAGAFTYLELRLSQLCWPIFMACDVVWSNPIVLVVSIGTYLFASLCAAYWLYQGRQVAQGFACLSLATLLMLLILSFGVRMHEISVLVVFLASAVYLVLPGKADTVRLLVSSLYFSSGLLKTISPEWISGDLIDRSQWMHGPLLKVACAYVIVLELIGALALLSSRRRIFILAAAQLAAFHFYSVLVVGFTLPFIMFCLLAFVSLAHRESDRSPLAGLVKRSLPASTYALLAIAASLQLVSMYGVWSSPFSSHARYLSLDHFTPVPRCRDRITLRYADGTTMDHHSFAHMLSTYRRRCDPLNYWSYSKRLCNELGSEKGFVDLDLEVFVRAPSDPEFHRMFVLERFCTNTPSFNPVYNAWANDRNGG